MATLIGDKLMTRILNKAKYEVKHDFSKDVETNSLHDTINI
jgi:hypothetical protein